MRVPERCPAVAGGLSIRLVDVLASAALGLLIAEYRAQLSAAELARHFADPLAAGGDKRGMRDARADLVADGLAHRGGEFFFATRAAMRAEYYRG